MYIMSDTKRINFTPVECMSLISLVGKYKDFIENKKIDTISLSRKREAWEQLTEEFNSDPNHSKKTRTQLEKKWDNEKSKRRKELAELKRREMEAGGQLFDVHFSQPPVETVLDLVGNQIKEETDVDSDTCSQDITGISSIPYYSSDEGNTLLKIEKPSDVQNIADEPPKKKKRVDAEDVTQQVAAQRLGQIEQQIRQDAECHSLRVKELQYRVQAAKEIARQEELKTKMLEKELEFKTKNQEMELMFFKKRGFSI